MPPPPKKKSNPTNQTAILIGQPMSCDRLQRQLDLLPAQNRPITIGSVVTDAATRGNDVDVSMSGRADVAVLGSLDQLESIIARRRPALALISLPAVMKDLVMSIRTRLRKLGVADRFMPTLEDQIAGVGPRTHVDVDVTALLDRPPRQIDENAIRSVIAGKCVLITGAGGSIGSELARIVARFEPQKLVLVDRSENALFEIDRQIARLHPHLARKALLHDVVDAAGTLGHFRELKPQVIFHAAAHKHVPMMEDHPAAAVDNNLFGTVAVADAADAVGAERLVMISSDKAVNPCSIMGATKRLAELYVQGINRRSRTGFSMVRFGNVLGSSGSVLETWARQIADGGPITVTDPRMTRYFMTIPEAAALVIQSAALVVPDSDCGEVFLLDMGEPIRIVDLAKRFIELHGLEAEVEGIDDCESKRHEGTEAGRHEGSRQSSIVNRQSISGFVRIVFSGIRPGEKLHEQLAYDAEAMRPTRHPDINIWELAPPDERFIRQMLEQLSPGGRSRDAANLGGQIRRLVPEMSAPAPQMAA